MEIEDFSFYHDHPMGDSATHPIEPLATRLGGVASPCGQEPTASSRLPRRAASGPLGRVQPLKEPKSGLARVEAASCRFPKQMRLEAAATGRIQCQSEFHPDQEI